MHKLLYVNSNTNNDQYNQKEKKKSNNQQQMRKINKGAGFLGLWGGLKLVAARHETGGFAVPYALLCFTNWVDYSNSMEQWKQ